MTYLNVGSKKSKLFARIYIFIVVLIFISCQREYTNPWDEKANFDPEAWAPKNFQIEDISITEKRLTWEYGDENIEGFKLDRKKGDENWQIAYQTFSKDTRSWSDTDILPELSVNFNYRLYAYAGRYESNSIELSTITAIPAPTGLTIEEINDKSSKISWIDNAIGEHGYKIDKKTGQSIWESEFAVLAPNLNSFIDTNVFRNVNISYRVYAYYEGFESLKVETEMLGNIEPPINVTITQNSLNLVSIQWNSNNSFIDGYKLDRKVNNESWTYEYSVLGKNITSFNDDVDLENNFYTYKIYAFISSFNSKYIEVVAATIGTYAFGGIIFYIDESGHGLVCAENDQSSGINWGCNQEFLGGTSTAFGTGEANTQAIISGCNEGDIAAKICSDYSISGYSDWFLPSKSEFNLIFENLHISGIGNFNGPGYWTSSEGSSNEAWVMHVGFGNWIGYYKYTPQSVRAVRAF